MCDISKSNFLPKMIYFGSCFIAVMIVMTIYVAKLSFWALKIFLVQISKILFKFVHSLVVKESEMKNMNSEMLDDDSDDDSAWEYAEEETLDDFHDSHQYVRWELPPEALDFYPMASLFSLHGVPYKWPSFPPTYYHDLPLPTGFLSFPSEFIHEPMKKIKKPKKSWKKRLLRGFKRKRVPTPTADVSDTSYESATEESDVESSELKITLEQTVTDESENEWVSIPARNYSNTSFGFETTEVKVTKCGESIEPYEQPHLNDKPSEWVDVPLKSPSSSSLETIEKQVVDGRESKEIREQPLLNEISSELVSNPHKDDSSILIEPTEERVLERPELKQTWKQRVLRRFSRKRASVPQRDDSNTLSETTEQSDTKHCKPKKTWKKRFVCCMSRKSSD